MMHLQLSIDTQNFDVFFQLMAILLWLLIVAVLFNNWEKIQKYKQKPLAFGLAAIIIISGIYFWLIGSKVIINDTARIVAFVLYAVYITSLFVAGVFTYHNTWYSKIELRRASSFQEWGPYVQFGTDASTEIFISWESETLAMKSAVIYSDSEQWASELLEITKVKPKISEFKYPKPTLHHCHHLTGLKPNTKYYYRISRDDFQIIYIFKTGLEISPGTQYEFCVVSDLHSSDQKLDKALVAMEKFVPEKRFVVALGDSVAKGEDERSWRHLMYHISPYTANTVWMHLSGEMDSKSPESYNRFLRTFDQPYVDLEKGAYFSWNFANIHCIMLDTQNAGQNTGKNSYWLSDEQIEWLEADLQKATLPAKQKWIMVFMHHAVYSTGAHGFNHALMNWLVPLFTKYHVDLVFSGHDHHFEAFYVSNPSTNTGTHYFVVGGTGKLDSWLTRAQVNPIYLWRDRIHQASTNLFTEGQPLHPARDDAAAKQYQIFGILARNLTRVECKDDLARVQCISLKGEILWEKTIKRNS